MQQVIAGNQRCADGNNQRDLDRPDDDIRIVSRPQAKNISSRYPAVSKIYQVIEESKPVKESYSAFQLVEDIDNIITVESTSSENKSISTPISNETHPPNENSKNWTTQLSCEFDRQFLHLVSQALPNKISALVNAYAQSKRPAARLESLIFSTGLNTKNIARGDSEPVHPDYLVDAWLDGTLQFLAENSILTDSPDHPFSNRMLNQHPALAGVLILALLRLNNLEKTKSFIARILEDDTAVFDKNLEMVLTYFLADVNEQKQVREKWFSQPSGELFATALRARLHLEDTPELIRFIEQQSTTSVDFWWLLSAMPPSDRLIKTIIGLSSEKRSIFGLFYPQEVVAEDYPIIDCRRNRAMAVRITNI